MGCCFGLEQQSFSSFATRERTLLYPLLFGECCMHLRGPPEPCTSDLSTQDGLIRKQSVCWLQELMGLAMPTLEQLKSLHLQHKAEITNHAWQRLLDLVLHLQARLPEGGIAQLLLLLSEHAQHTQQLGEAAAVGDGIPSIQAAQLGQHQAAGLQTCLVACCRCSPWCFMALGGRPLYMRSPAASSWPASRGTTSRKAQRCWRLTSAQEQPLACMRRHGLGRLACSRRSQEARQQLLCATLDC